MKNSLNLSAISEASNRGALLPRNLANNLYVSPVPAPSPVVNAVATNALNIPVNATNVPPARRKFLCDANFTKRIGAGAASLQGLAISNVVLGQGSYGRVVNGEIAVATDTGETLQCVAAIKQSLAAQRTELQPDILKEIAAYARLQGAPGVSQALFFKFAPQQISFVMTHYLTTLKGILDAVFVPFRMNLSAIYDKLMKAILFQILTGVATLEANSILHRDIKPANILMANDGTILIADYGLLAHQPLGFDKPQTMYVRTGTPYYLAPEMIQQTKSWGGARVAQKPFLVDGRADIWSVGCTMLYCLAGTDAFKFPIYPGQTFKQSILSMTQDVDEMYKKRRDDVIFDLQRGLAQEGIGLSPDGWSLLRSLLMIRPTDRPTARVALANPWFAGMTAKTARATVQKAMSLIPVPAGVPNPLRQLSQQIRQTTALLNNPAAPRNANLAAYTQLRGGARPWAPSVFEVDPARRTHALSVLWGLGTRHERMSPLILLHAMELFDRVFHAETDFMADEALPIGCACLAIANKLSEFYKSHLTRLTIDVLFEYVQVLVPSLNDADIREAELVIVRELGGDLFQLPDGLSVRVAQELLAAPSPYLVGQYESITFFKCLRYYLFLVVYAVLPGSLETSLAVAKSLADYLHPILTGPAGAMPAYRPVPGHADFVAAAAATPLPDIGLFLAQLKAWSFHFPRLPWMELFGFDILRLGGPGLDSFPNLMDQFGAPYPRF